MEASKEMTETPAEIRKRLLANAEDGYREFSEKITVPSAEHKVIGIRMPILKRFAKDICAGDWKRYLNETEDEYSEDMMLRAFIIVTADISNEERFQMVREFVPKIDNWAVCDSFCSLFKVNKNNKDEVWNFILPFLDTGEEFQIRFTVAMMLCHFVDTEHIEKIISYMDPIKHDAYYVKMAVAWCLSVCFMKFPDETMRYLKNNTLDKFTFNKTLSKITDSFRVSNEAKEEIRKMRRK